MRSHVFTLVSLLLGSALATENWSNININLKALNVRAGGGFQPDTTQGHGANCGEAFGAGYVSCGSGNDCYSPSSGEECCSEGYPCPSDSFCLAAGYCCPNGMDPATCAKENGVPWPSSTPKPASSTPKPTPYPTTAHTTPKPYSSPSPVATSVHSTEVGTVTICPSSSSKAYNVTAPTVYPTTAPPAFTGAASPQNVAGGAVAILGLLGLLQNLL